MENQNKTELSKAIGNVFGVGKLVDVTQAIQVVQNKWGLIGTLGLFEDQPKSQKIVQINREHETVQLVEDANWNGHKQATQGADRDYTMVKVPHFPLQDMILPEDLDGNIDLDALFRGEIDVPLTLQKVMAEKFVRMNNNLDVTLEFARAMMLRDGTVYAPKGTVATNFYTEFGITRDVITTDLASVTDDPIGQMSDVFAMIQDDTLTGQVVTDVICLCSTEYFNALISNPFIKESYMYFLQPQGRELLNQRLGTRAPLDARYRAFDYAGITFIENRGGVGGVRYVEAGKAYIFPRGTDSFRTFYAPAQKFGTINQSANNRYAWTKVGEDDDKIELTTESNFLNANVRPQIVKTLQLA